MKHYQRLYIAGRNATHHKTPTLSFFLLRAAQHGQIDVDDSSPENPRQYLAKAQKLAWVRVYSPTAFTGVWGNIVREDNVYM